MGRTYSEEAFILVEVLVNFSQIVTSWIVICVVGL